MALRIVMQNWKMVEGETGKVIAGTFSVKNGDKKVASKEFNDGYDAISVPIPAEVLAEAEKIDEKVRKAVEVSFGIEAD